MQIYFVQFFNSNFPTGDDIVSCSCVVPKKKYIYIYNLNYLFTLWAVQLLCDHCGERVIHQCEIIQVLTDTRLQHPLPDMCCMHTGLLLVNTDRHTIDIAFIIPGFFGNAGSYLPVIVQQTGSNTIFYLMVLSIGYAWYSIAQGKTPDQIPIVSDAAAQSIGPM